MILPHPDSQGTAKPTSDFNPYAHYEEAMIPMRDGVRLAADIHYPVDEDGEPITDPAPVLLVRTSYDKSKDEWDTVRDYYPRHGYVFVNQDLRSRFRSEGDGRYYHTCNPWEGEDGYDTIEWIAKQPWCNGKIGTLGSSHRGIVQTVAALHQAPSSRRPMGRAGTHQHLRPRSTRRRRDVLPHGGGDPQPRPRFTRTPRQPRRRPSRR